MQYGQKCASYKFQLKYDLKAKNRQSMHYMIRNMNTRASNNNVVWHFNTTALQSVGIDSYLIRIRIFLTVSS